MRPTLLIFRPFSPRSRDFLLSHLGGSYDILEPENRDEDHLAALMARADVVLGDKIPSHLFDHARNVRLVHAPGNGIDQFDLGVLKDRGIDLANSHSSAPFVAEHTVAMLLSLIKKVTVHDRLIRQGTWFRPTGNPEEDILFSDSLIGKTIGFLGYGRIAREIARLMRGFDARVIAAVRDPGRHADSEPAAEFMNAEAVFSTADAVIVTVPLTAVTDGMVDSRLLGAIKPSGYLASVSRAEVIVEEDLWRALHERWFRGAALDIWYEGSKTEISRSAFVDNLILSPHRADTHRDFAPHLADVVDDLLAYAATGEIRNQVNLEAGY